MSHKYQTLDVTRDDPLLHDAYVLVLVSLHRVLPDVLSRVLIDAIISDCAEEKELNDRAVYDLISEGLVCVSELDSPLAEFITGGFTKLFE